MINEHIYKSSLLEEPFCRALGEVKREQHEKKKKKKLLALTLTTKQELLYEVEVGGAFEGSDQDVLK